MTTTIDQDDLVDGISLWPGIPDHTLLQLIPQPDREDGLAGGATDSVCAWARRRAMDDYDQRGIDIDNPGDSDAVDRVKSSMCFLVMSRLYGLNSASPDDFYHMQDKQMSAEYYRILGTATVTSTAGYQTDVGTTIEIMRGS